MRINMRGHNWPLSESSGQYEAGRWILIRLEAALGTSTGGCVGANPGVLIRLATFRKAAGNMKQVDGY